MTRREFHRLHRRFPLHRYLQGAVKPKTAASVYGAHSRPAAASASALRGAPASSARAVGMLYNAQRGRTDHAQVAGRTIAVRPFRVHRHSVRPALLPPVQFCPPLQLPCSTDDFGFEPLSETNHSIVYHRRCTARDTVGSEGVSGTALS
jgi:hypothetical protein